MTSLIDKNSVVAFGDIQETADAYILNDAVIGKSIVPDAVLIDSEPEYASENGWLYIDGVFVEQQPVPAPVDYEAEAQNRKTRNAMLADCDWTQLGDVNLTADCKDDFIAYRQALRDVDLFDPVWPTAPVEEWATTQ
jgi:hypothetical protein